MALNHELATIFFEIGEILQRQDIPFKPLMYQQAAIRLDELEEDIIDIYAKNGVKSLMDIPGIGDSIAAKIEEYLKTGKIQYYESLKQEINN